MSSVQRHYDRHLGPVYAWMAGGVEAALERGAAELDAVGVEPSDGGTAVDLGAGFGMHAVPLARRGFTVLAVDSCAALLDELRARAAGLPVRPVLDDLRAYSRHLDGPADLVLCLGDTVTHLPDEASVERLVETVSADVRVGGRFVVSLRDYTVPLTAERRFVPVRSDADRILTCFLEYGESRVTVHDVLHEREGDRWRLSVGAYEKLRLSPEWLRGRLEASGFAVDRGAGAAGMVRLVAERV